MVKCSWSYDAQSASVALGRWKPNLLFFWEAAISSGLGSSALGFHVMVMVLESMMLALKSQACSTWPVVQAGVMAVPSHSA